MTTKEVKALVRESIDSQEMMVFMPLEARRVIYKALCNIENLSRIMDVDAIAKEANKV